jgi:tRNA G18 (ribose-2'-O)-methylase SpoU
LAARPAFHHAFFALAPLAPSWLHGAVTDASDRVVGVGPHPEPWPDDPRLDPMLLEHGDRRNVVDAYRYWRVEAIVEDLDRRRHPFHVVVENWTRDPNIGAVVRNANAFNAAAVHIIGRHRWNRRGAMKTEAYMHLFAHDSIDEFVTWARSEALDIVGVDNLEGAQSLFELALPRRCALLFGQEGPGLSNGARQACSTIVAIPQFGSTRSINAGAASAVAMYAWCERHAR